MQEQVGFADLNIAPELVELLHRNNLGAPTEVQVRLIPAALDGRDCLARVRSGSGKTNAYILPIVQRIDPSGGLQALVFQPTKALAAQLERNMRRYSGARGVRVELAEGAAGRGDDPRGRSRFDSESSAPQPDAPPHVLIGTPRTIEERLNPKLNANDVRFVVLDEADVLLEQDGRRVEELLVGVRNDRQVFVLSSTLDDRVRAFAADFQRDPLVVEIEPAAAQSTRADQAFMRVGPGMHFDMLLSFAKQVRPRLALVYARDEEIGREIAERLYRARVDARWIDVPPARGGRRDDRGGVVVVCDPPPPRVGTLPVSHIVHYDPPPDAAGYQARVDAATRLNRTGYSVLLLDAEQAALVPTLGAALGKPLREMEPLEVPERARRGERGRRDDSDTQRERGSGDEFDARGGPADAQERGEPGARGERDRRGRDGGRDGGRNGGRDGGRGGRDGGRGGRDRGREGGRDPNRYEAPRDGSSERSAPRPAAGAKPAPSSLAAQYGPMYHDAELEARGLTPLPRTLGNRFAARRRRTAPRLRRMTEPDQAG